MHRHLLKYLCFLHKKPTLKNNLFHDRKKCIGNKQGIGMWVRTQLEKMNRIKTSQKTVGTCTKRQRERKNNRRRKRKIQRNKRRNIYYFIILFYVNS